ncbi:unnamed protein product [Parajaminaea phylloscopi]
MAVDAIVRRKVAEAKTPTPRKLLPLLRYLLFHVYFVPTSVAILPFYLLLSLFPRLRKDARWSFIQNLSVLYVRRVIRIYCRFRVQPIQPRENGWRESNSVIGTALEFANLSGPGGRVVHPKEAIRAAEQAAGGKRSDRVWIDPPPLDAFRGILTINTQGPGKGYVHSKTYQGPPLVEPGMAKLRTRCFWFMHRDGLSPPNPAEKRRRDRPVILYFHGGAGVTFGAGDLFMGQTFARNLAHTTGIDVFSVDYLLAPTSRWPGHIVQALAGWFYLTRQLGYQPSQIITAGDSFGGALNLQLNRYLLTDFPGYEGYDVERNGEKPGAMVLFSPFVDARADGDLNLPPCAPVNGPKDIILLDYGTWGFEAQGVFLGPAAMQRCPKLQRTDPWFSQIFLPLEELKQYPPMFVLHGGCELLHDMVTEFVGRARQAGVPHLEHDVLDYGVHDYWTLHTFLPEARASYEKIKAWWAKIERAGSHL